MGINDIRKRIEDESINLIFSQKQKTIVNNMKARFSDVSDLLDQQKRTIKKNLTSALSEEVDVSKVSQMLLDEVHNQQEKGEFYSKGFNGKVYLVDMEKIIGKKKKLLIMKSNLLQGKKGREKILHEYNYHTEAQHILENIDIDDIRTPRIYGMINDNNETLLVMDFIEGLTVFSFKVLSVIEKIIEHIQEHRLLGYDDTIKEVRKILAQGESDKNIKRAGIFLLDRITQDVEMDDFVGKYIGDRLTSYNQAKNKYGGIFFERFLAQIFDKLSNDSELGFLQQEEGMRMKKSLSDVILKMNKGGVYHNDLNMRNIILGSDGRIYLIDFDKALHEESPLKRKIKRESRSTTVKRDKHTGEKLLYDNECLAYFDSFITNN